MTGGELDLDAAGEEIHSGLMGLQIPKRSDNESFDNAGNMPIPPEPAP